MKTSLEPIEDIINVVLTAGTFDERKLEELNGIPWYRTERGLVACNDPRIGKVWYGGDKHLEVNVWIGAFRGLRLDKLIAAIRQVAWEEPECVRLYVSEGDKGRFKRIHWQNTTNGSSARGTNEP